jgi:two-component system sensor histidine kinase/response regulator
MDGSVGVESAVGAGSTFWFTVRLRIRASQQRKPMSDVDPQDQRVLDVQDLRERLATLRGSRILLVEDNEMNQEVATELLRSAGFIVESAENGRIAVDKLRLQPYDLVLMDMQMPEMDGITATQEIRKEARFRSLPVIAMTANAMPSDRQRCRLAGMNDHVSKPIEPQDLWQALLKWITPRPLTASPEVQSVPVEEVELPSAIHGLDVAKGLGRVMGNRSLYQSMLRKFMGAQSTVLEEIAGSLDQVDWHKAERLAHTLKGVAATIAAEPVRTLADGLEQAIAKGLPRVLVDDLLHQLRSPLEDLLGELQEKLPPERLGLTVQVDQDKLHSVCAALQTLLADDDSQAADVFDENADLLQAAFPGHFAALEAGVRAFDFEAASMALSAALKSVT